MKATTIAATLVLLGAALTASPQALPLREHAAKGVLEAPSTTTLPDCGYLVTATVLDLIDAPGTETSAPTYAVRELAETGSAYLQKSTALDHARLVAANGLRVGDVFYPSSTIRRVVVSPTCP